MAVTKTHPIKRALKAAIDYICNPEKTDAGDGDNDRFREAADHVEDAAIPSGWRHAHLAGDLAHLRIHGTTNRTKDRKSFLCQMSIKLYASMGRSTPSSKPRTKRGS